jgi:teichuronic acid biosynthesis glycosyltransferase TuaC
MCLAAIPMAVTHSLAMKSCTASATAASDHSRRTSKARRTAGRLPSINSNMTGVPQFNRAVGVTVEQGVWPSIRVLSVIPEPKLQSSMIFARRQVRWLQNAGVVCTTFFLASRTSPLIMAREVLRLRKLTRSFCPDIVHAHFGTMTAFLAALSSQVPLVITYRGSDLNHCSSLPKLRSMFGTLLSQVAALRATRVICVSEQLRTRLWWRKDIAIVIPSGVDISIFHPRPKNEAREALGWRSDELVVLFNASQEPVIKRLDLAEAAVRVAEASCGKIRLVVLRGDLAPDTVPIMMAAADAILVTSDSEGSPNVVKEAMACDLPVVSVAVGDVRERLVGVTPSRVVARDAGEIGKAVAEILLQCERSNGSSMVKSISSIETAKKTIAVYQMALTNAPAQRKHLSTCGAMNLQRTAKHLKDFVWPLFIGQTRGR